MVEEKGTGLSVYSSWERTGQGRISNLLSQGRGRIFLGRKRDNREGPINLLTTLLGRGEEGGESYFSVKGGKKDFVKSGWGRPTLFRRRWERMEIKEKSRRSYGKKGESSNSQLEKKRRGFKDKRSLDFCKPTWKGGVP